ncbi:hypothetical protein EMIHUDRAFT_214476 [Emiliania huxleyi CCMP1516]|uniref:Nicastrin n=2 Tax=Emiliania huxleyi TaxID=2903 RepID=A0A0D3IK34_EMIH1|nr:hypothetical protein EMIHUDRAFT_214476 [Emiliania huxleyi CCMP1516]EOD11619.1 hypothetical protein EMIHUDRAFT_214476 [Emiliania huxleyi CCMP1516]|eukprot:XP_005764048.1 hypothetical protein EMIHUDRAFT_214476 [Emiliania huxleyi CCMP1516]
MFHAPIALLSLLLFSTAAAKGRESAQFVKLTRADPCVRLLSADGPSGCATPAGGAIAPLVAVESREALARVLNATEPVSVALSAELFEASVMHSLRQRLGGLLRGVAVLHSEGMPRGWASPEPASEGGGPGPGGTVLNPSGSGLSRDSFDFGVVLLSAGESAALLGAVRAGGSPLLELKYPMFATGDSLSCLAEGSCLPLGGQSVWGALPPRTAAQSPPAKDKPAVMLTASLDAAAFFHEHAAGAEAAVSGTVALLAAVASVARLAGSAEQLEALPRTPAFALFTGEAYGQIGSRRFFGDVETFRCDNRSREEGAAPQSAAPHPLGPPPSCASPYKPDLRPEAASAERCARRRASEGPASRCPSLGTLADYDAERRGGGRYGSRFDTLEGIDASLVCEASAVAAAAWWRLAGGEGSPAPNCSLVEERRELLGCFLTDPRCATATQLEVEPPTSRYTSAFLPLRGELAASGTAKFAAAFLRAALAPLCPAEPRRSLFPGASGTAEEGSPLCEPTVLTHDAVSPSLEYDAEAGIFRLVDEAAVANGTDALWTESNWPRDTHATLWLYRPSPSEPPLLFAFAATSMATTLAVVALSCSRINRKGWLRVSD